MNKSLLFTSIIYFQAVMMSRDHHQRPVYSTSGEDIVRSCNGMIEVNKYIKYIKVIYIAYQGDVKVMATGHRLGLYLIILGPWKGALNHLVWHERCYDRGYVPILRKHCMRLSPLDLVCFHSARRFSPHNRGKSRYIHSTARLYMLTSFGFQDTG